MPKKPNSSGELQNYVPKGNGDASGEYADGGGYNIHYFEHFEKQVQGEIKNIDKLAKIKEEIANKIDNEELDNNNFHDYIVYNDEIKAEDVGELSKYFNELYYKKHPMSKEEIEELTDEDLDVELTDEEIDDILKEDTSYQEDNEEQNTFEDFGKGSNDNINNVKQKIVDKLHDNTLNEENFVEFLKGEMSKDAYEENAGSLISFFVDELMTMESDVLADETNFIYDKLNNGEMDKSQLMTHINDLQTTENVKNKLTDYLINLEEPKKQKEQEELQLEMNTQVEEKPKKKFNKSAIKTYTDSECYDTLLTTFNGEFDEEKIKNLSSKELHDLTLAKYLDVKGTLDNKINKYYKELKDFIQNEENGLNDVWVKIPETPEELENSIKNKIAYYQNKIEMFGNMDSSWAKEKKEKFENLLDNVKQFEEKSGSIYDNWIKAYSDKEENTSLLNKYSNPNNVYSQKSKDEALWFKSKNASNNYLTPITQKTLQELGTISPDYENAIKKYTSSYSYINEPLRNLHYVGSSLKKNAFVKDVEDMTFALDNSKSQDNMWLQRGVKTLNINGINLTDSSLWTTSDLKKLVGTSFEDMGFVSCGSSKGAGFSDKPIIMNIYAPKGTKMMYVAPISSFEEENETIIQRGYSYNITKVEKSGGKIYLDCEVVLGSDVKKHNHKQLLELQKNNFS